MNCLYVHVLTCCSVKENGPIFIATTCFFSVSLSPSESDLNHMALVIIVKNNKDMQQEILWTRVNELRVGREKTDSQRWSLVNFLRTDDEKSCLKATRSSILATGRTRSTIPSSSSQASHRLQRKKYLEVGKVHIRFIVIYSDICLKRPFDYSCFSKENKHGILNKPYHLKILY